MKKILTLALVFAAASNICGEAANNYSGVEINTVKDATSMYGAIRGRVLDSNKQVLPGATVSIPNLGVAVVTDVDGYYTLSGLKGGTYEIEVHYIGCATKKVQIKVGKRQTIALNVELCDGVALDEVVVKGAFCGERRAINAQKSAFNLVNVVSSDQVGKFPDTNIGDALKRISGINVQYDQGEARFGQIRGTSPELSSVMVNGDRMPSAEGETRAVQLDLIPADMIQTIEVNKVVTADMDADAIGGAVNLVTKNAPTHRMILAHAGSGYNQISEDAQLDLGFTYGDTFFNNKLGVMVSASYQNDELGSDNTEFEYDLDDDEVVLKDFQIRQYYLQRVRQSYSLGLNWDINNNNKISFKSLYNQRNDQENRFRFRVKDLHKDKSKVYRQTKGGASDTDNRRLELQKTMDFTLHGEHLWGKLETKWKLGYSQASEDRPNERYITLSGKAVAGEDFDIYMPGTRDVNLINMNPEKFDIEELGLKELTEEQEAIMEKNFKASLKFELPLRSGDYGNKLRFGAKFNHKDKEYRKEFIEYSADNDDAEDAFLALALQNVSNQTRDGFYPGSEYKAGDFVNPSFLGGLKMTGPTTSVPGFAGETVNEEVAGEYDATETVTAGYIRFDQKIGDDFKLMAGLRVENTRVKYSGFNYDMDEDELSATGESSESYTNFLPSILAKWEVNKNMNVRASFTNTLSRPRYSHLVPRANVSMEDNEISLGNAELDPSLAYNFDLSTDYYFKDLGMISAGVFYKRINDFIVERTVGDFEYNGHVYDKLTQPVNAGDADLFGAELTYQRDFGFIHPSLKCVGFGGNYTYTYSKVSELGIPDREGEDSEMPGTPEHAANASLFYQKAGLSVRLSYNHASSFIDEIGEAKELDRYYDAVDYLDLNASYTFAKHYTVYANATNLLNQPLRYYQGTEDRTMQVEYYGVKVNAGIKVRF